MAKSPDAFRTISEVADWLGVHAHVLRFWESKFSQVKPVKRAGGRRYYRPSDMQLLGGIKKLLHEDGMTIKGAQKVLREQGIAAVAAMSRPIDDAHEATEAAAPASDVTEPQSADADVPHESAESVEAPAEDATSEEESAPDDEVIQLPPRRKRAEAGLPGQLDMFESPTDVGSEPEDQPKPADETPDPVVEVVEEAEEPKPVLAAPEPAADASPDPEPKAVRTRPLPPSGTPVLEALKTLEPGQVPPIRLQAIHAQLVALRARMEDHA